jgi:WW domain-containing oxidoreductase
VSGGLFIFQSISSFLIIIIFLKELPHGWERKVLEDGTIIYVDHVREKTSFTDPRLAFAKIEKHVEIELKRFPVDNTTIATSLLNDRDLTNTTAIITGANKGLGFEIARSLSFAGCYVILACRSVESGERACEKLKKERVSLRLIINY